MFDIGFWELAMLALIALLVVGPERLPKLARTAGLWVGRGRAFLSSVKSDIDRELRAEELKKILDEQMHSNPLEEILDDTRQSVRDIEKSAGKAIDDAQRGFDSEGKPTTPRSKGVDA